MRIVVDVSSVARYRTGIGHATYEMTRRLPLVAKDDELVFLFNSLRQPVPRYQHHKHPRFALETRRIPGPLLLYAWRWLDLPNVEAFAGPADVVHSPATYILPQRRGATVVTIHDLYFLDAPENADRQPLGDAYLRACLERRLPSVDAIVCPSSLTAGSVERHFGHRVPDLSKRLYVVPWGVSPRFFRTSPPQDDAPVLRHLGVTKPYLLAVGGGSRRKNLRGLLDAMRLVRSEMGEVPWLVLGGVAPDAPLLASFRDLPIRALGYVPHHTMPALLRGAEAFVCPAHLEGFGLPILEALAAATPVVTTPRVGALEFVEPDSAVIAENSAPDALAAAVVRVLSNSELSARLRAVGPPRARSLTWLRCARETYRVYQKACANTRKT